MTIFVHNDTNISDEALNKIEKLRRFKLKLKFLHIHGKNISNVQKIKEFLDLEKETDSLNVEIKPLLEKKNLIVIELYPN